MADEKLIGPAPASTPSTLLRSGKRTAGIPDDLLHEASLRLGIMSLLGAILWAVATIAGHLANAATVSYGGQGGPLALTPCFCLMVGVFFLGAPLSFHGG